MKFIAAFIFVLILGQASAQNDSLMPNLSATYPGKLQFTERIGTFIDYTFSNPNPGVRYCRYLHTQ